MRNLYYCILSNIFVWIGARLFPVVAFYTPDKNSVKVIHFAANKWHLRQSFEEGLENLNETEPECPSPSDQPS